MSMGVLGINVDSALPCVISKNKTKLNNEH
jgi:hypothetical protein